MPLTEKVSFKTALQKGNRVLIPSLLRSQFKMESSQVLRVGVSVLAHWKASQFFYARMGKDGRIFVPELTLSLLQNEKPSLVGSILEVTLEPFETSTQERET